MFLGAYVPLTMEGRIMVDEVLTSCYADFDPDLAHLTMISMQRFSEVLKWIFGEDTGFPGILSVLQDCWVFSCCQISFFRVT